jgi:hypothetical protein
MNALLEQLNDIDGLDSISGWPLAIGWWVLIAAALLLTLGLIGYLIYWMTFKRSWKSDTFQKLDDLEKNLSDTTARETVIVLSEYLRRIALRRFSRKECAGLAGEAWLKWLTTHDPKRFDWEKRGVLLIDIPYSPENASLSAGQIKELIHATRSWVK